MHWDVYPATGMGSYRHERQDAQMLGQMGVDYLKYDWCRADETDGLKQQETFALMRGELARLDRPIVYSISEYGTTKPWTWAPEVANLWRTTSDIIPFWPSIVAIIDQQADLYRYAGPANGTTRHVAGRQRAPHTGRDPRSRGHVGDARRPPDDRTDLDS